MSVRKIIIAQEGCKYVHNAKIIKVLAKVRIHKTFITQTMEYLSCLIIDFIIAKFPYLQYKVTAVHYQY